MTGIPKHCETNLTMSPKHPGNVLPAGIKNAKDSNVSLFTNKVHAILHALIRIPSPVSQYRQFDFFFNILHAGK